MDRDIWAPENWRCKYRKGLMNVLWMDDYNFLCSFTISWTLQQLMLFGSQWLLTNSVVFFGGWFLTKWHFKIRTTEEDNLLKSKFQFKTQPRVLFQCPFLLGTLTSSFEKYWERNLGIRKIWGEHFHAATLLGERKMIYKGTILGNNFWKLRLQWIRLGLPCVGLISTGNMQVLTPIKSV